jgi:CubicO group peptidase (beta-lactamase class C family)
VIAPDGEKALYMGYANMPTANGWAWGSKLAGHLYDTMGDKANLALRYLSEHQGITSGVTREEATAKLGEVLKMNGAQTTTLLWNTYAPYRVWYPFAGIGIASAVAIFLYARWVRRYEAPDI